MKSLATVHGDSNSRLAREFLEFEGAGWLHCDWAEVVFLHYQIEPDQLKPWMPMELDLWEGQAFVSLVAFTMRRLKSAIGGPLFAWITRPFATQRFLNLRTYVRSDAAQGIYFIKEWNSSRTCVWLAPRVYGLPYRHATLDYHHEHAMRRGSGTVKSGGSDFSFNYQSAETGDEMCAPGSIDEFLLERYAAFAAAGGRARFFRVRHAPWLQQRATMLKTDDTLLRHHCPWWKEAQFTCANVSRGAFEVSMGRPRRSNCHGPAA